MFKRAIPVLHVSNSATAEDFYCTRLGFRRQFAYRVDDAKPDTCYMGLTRVAANRADRFTDVGFWLAQAEAD